MKISAVISAEKKIFTVNASTESFQCKVHDQWGKKN